MDKRSRYRTGQGAAWRAIVSPHRLLYAGDTVLLTAQITDIYDKKNGALEFVVIDSAAHNQHDELVANLRGVIVVRH